MVAEKPLYSAKEISGKKKKKKRKKGVSNSSGEDDPQDDTGIDKTVLHFNFCCK